MGSRTQQATTADAIGRVSTDSPGSEVASSFTKRMRGNQGDPSDGAPAAHVLFRAAADEVLSLSGQGPTPRGRKSQPWLAARRPSRRYLPGLIIVLHTFGSDLKWNPHLHMIVTAGGLNGAGERLTSLMGMLFTRLDGRSPCQRYLVAPLLATEWKLNVLHGVRRAHQSQPLVRRRLRSDPRRRIEVDKLLGHIRKKRWHILIGPSLKSADQAVRYACRYTKRPVIAEGRIIKFAQGHVTFRFKDYHQDRKIRVRKLPVLTFIDRLELRADRRMVGLVDKSVTWGYSRTSNARLC